MAPQIMTVATFLNRFIAHFCEIFRYGTEQTRFFCWLWVSYTAKMFLVWKDDGIINPPSEKLPSFLDSCSSLSLGQVVNFLHGFSSKSLSTMAILMHRPIAFLSETLPHLLNHLHGFHVTFSIHFLKLIIIFCEKKNIEKSPVTLFLISFWKRETVNIPYCYLFSPLKGCKDLTCKLLQNISVDGLIESLLADMLEFFFAKWY
jgi:hypothetical protein